MGHSTRTDNPGRDDHWTCPACYADMPQKSEGLVTRQCGARVKLEITQQPVCTATIAGSEESGCEICGDSDFHPNVEAFETLDQILCDDCAPGALEDAAESVF